MTGEPEVVLGYGGEGGSVEIVRFAADDGTWLYRKTSRGMGFDGDDELIAIRPEDPPPPDGLCWVEALDLVSAHPWHLLYPTAMHPEYRDVLLREAMRKAMDQPDERSAEGLRDWLRAYRGDVSRRHDRAADSVATLPLPVIDTIRHAERVMVLTGAGISAESGIPTFRDALTGLWENFNPAELANADAFETDPELVWGWYEWRRAAMLKARPNAGHIALAELAALKPATLLVTQNVDDLHERAGSPDVVHLHGELQRPYCMRCRATYRVDDRIPDIPEAGARIAPPRCGRCRGTVRPGVVWFGENLSAGAWDIAHAGASQCDVLLAIGTSAQVAPASSLIDLARRRGALTVQINPNPPGNAAATDYWLPYGAGDALTEISRCIREGAGP
ncbi:MAG: hypothetical protein RLZZ200_1315 [Pseudomonadota bacterium]|jgi:NAD-dependent deacetylase